MFLHPSRLLLSLALLLSIFYTVQAQDDPAAPCTIDLSAAMASLADAQASASNGDQAAALETITIVQEQLQAIKTACAPESPDLSQTYTGPEDLFTVQYPAEWFISPFKAGRDWNTMLAGSTTLTLPAGGSVVLSSEPIEDDSSLSSGTVPTQGSQIFLSVGNPLHILESTGLYNEDASTQFLEDGLTLEALGEQFAVALSSEDTDSLSMVEVDALHPSLALDLRETETPFYVLLVQLNDDETLYAVLIGSAETGEQANIPRLTAAIADTIQVPE